MRLVALLCDLSLLDFQAEDSRIEHLIKLLGYRRKLPAKLSNLTGFQFDGAARSCKDKDLIFARFHSQEHGQTEA